MKGGNATLHPDTQAQNEPHTGGTAPVAQVRQCGRTADALAKQAAAPGPSQTVADAFAQPAVAACAKAEASDIAAHMAAQDTAAQAALSAPTNAVQLAADSPAAAHAATAPVLAISCDVCRDLMPLVRDGVASDDSAALVEAHTVSCKACAAMLETGSFSQTPEAQADANIIRRLRKTLLLRSAVIALAGVAGGMVLSVNMYPYITWWLPFVGALSYFVMRRRWWLAPLSVGVLTAAAMFVKALLTYYPNFSTLVVMPAYNGIVWLIYTAVGTAIGALLYFAFGKEK